MNRGKEKQQMFQIVKVLVLSATLLLFQPITTVKAQINEENCEEVATKTAYIDMSATSPLQLHFTEENEETMPDYYYASQAYAILKEYAKIDSMYQNCREVIVTIDQVYSTKNVMITTCEPQAKTGYLNLLSKETNKRYTIDEIVIHIQRD